MLLVLTQVRREESEESYHATKYNPAHPEVLDMIEVEVFPLASNAVLPVPAPAATRSQVPPGYGVQEQCLPFTAATALGFLVRSPFTFGLCPPADVPAGAHAFVSPIAAQRTGAAPDDTRVFYVKDDPERRFARNAFTLDALGTLQGKDKRPYTPVHPGLSFFDRADQQDLFKLHLPYTWHTPPEIDTLFLPPINRPARGLTLMAGLVETDWYPTPVNMIFRKPPAVYSVHVAAGDNVAQVMFLMRSHRRPTLKVIAPHARLARDLRARMVEWDQQQAKDRSLYKKSARSAHGRIPNEGGPTRRRISSLGVRFRRSINQDSVEVSMKRFHFSLVVGLLVAPLLCGARAAAQQSPREVASEFYTLIVREDSSGLPDEAEMRLLRPYMSRALLSLFERAGREQARAVREHPDEKPPLVEGCLFSCAFEGPKRFSVGRPRVSGRFAYVAVEQRAEPGQNVEWTDTLVLVKERGRWLVWDVRMGCKWDFRMGPTLRAMLGAK